MAVFVRDSEGELIGGIEAVVLTAGSAVVKYADPKRGKDGDGLDTFARSFGEITVTNEIEER